MTSKYFRKIPLLNQFLLLRANNPYKASERKVPENLHTIFD